MVTLREVLGSDEVPKVQAVNIDLDRKIKDLTLFESSKLSFVLFPRKFEVENGDSLVGARRLMKRAVSMGFTIFT